MAAWLIPALKAVIPHIGTIVSAATPVFTKKGADAAANQTALLQQQITELQAAASDNDAHIKKLAAEIQNAVAALESGASLAQTRYQRIWALCIVATVLGVVSLLAAAFILLAR